MAQGFWNLGLVFCPLGFLALALWGLLVERDLRWMLLAQPLQLRAFLQGQAHLGPGKLQYYGRLWLSLGQLCQRWDAWLRPSGTLLLVLRLGLALAILDPLADLNQLQGPLLLSGLRSSWLNTPRNCRALATRA